MATLHFLQTDQLDRDHLAAVERLAVLRSRADDLPHGKLTADHAAESVELATAFVEAAREWLATHGFAGDAA